MRYFDETITEMAREKSSAKRRVNKAVLAILLLADEYRDGDGRFSFDKYPELDDQVNLLLIEMSDGLLKQAENRARKILSWLELRDFYADEALAEAESGDEGLTWALDMHASNLKKVVEAWVVIMFANGMTVHETYPKVIAYMAAPDASPLWKESIRARLVDKNEVRFGKGYQRRVAEAVAILLQTFLYTVLVAGTLRKGVEGGAYGYRVFRQSGYDCPLCDSLTEGIWPIGTRVLPAHPRCVCGIELVYPES